MVEPARGAPCPGGNIWIFPVYEDEGENARHKADIEGLPNSTGFSALFRYSAAIQLSLRHRGNLNRPNKPCKLAGYRSDSGILVLTVH